MSEYEITVRVKTNSNNKKDIETAVVEQLLYSTVITSVEDIKIFKVEADGTVRVPIRSGVFKTK